MARGVRLRLFDYEIDVQNPKTKTRAVKARCGILMDAYNVKSGTKYINESSSTQLLLPFRVSLRKNNIKEIGIHPRYIEGVLQIVSNASNCYGADIKRRVFIPVLTLAQFEAFNVYDFKQGGDQPNTTISVNHSFNGTTLVDYRIARKVDQLLV